MTATIEENKTDSASQTESQVETPTEAKPAKKEKRPFVFTPYQAMKAVNEALEAAGSETRLQGPMLYQYAKQGKFKSFPAPADIERGAPEHEIRLEVDRDSYDEWEDKFVASHAKDDGGVTDPENLEDDGTVEDPEPIEVVDKSETIEDADESDGTDEDDDEIEEAE